MAEGVERIGQDPLQEAGEGRRRHYLLDGLGLPLEAILDLPRTTSSSSKIALQGRQRRSRKILLECLEEFSAVANLPSRGKVGKLIIALNLFALTD